MRIALFRARATRCGPLPIDRIPEYIDHGTPHTNLSESEDSLAGQVFKNTNKNTCSSGKKMSTKLEPCR
jgi:hypothetical protein